MRPLLFRGASLWYFHHLFLMVWLFAEWKHHPSQPPAEGSVVETFSPTSQ